MLRPEITGRFQIISISLITSNFLHVRHAQISTPMTLLFPSLPIIATVKQLIVEVLHHANGTPAHGSTRTYHRFRCLTSKTHTYNPKNASITPTSTALAAPPTSPTCRPRRRSAPSTTSKASPAPPSPNSTNNPPPPSPSSVECCLTWLKRSSWRCCICLDPLMLWIWMRG